MDVTCQSCGAENYESARYCRKCGFQLGSSEFHEAPTRGLDHQRPDEPQVPARAFETFGSAQLPSDGPRYAPPVVSPSAAGLQPANLTGMPARIETGPMSAPTGPASKGPNWFLIIGAIVLAAFIGGVSMLVMVADRIRSSGDRPARGGSETTKGGDAPPITPPPPPPGAAMPQSVDAWKYEGAAVTVSMPNVLVMETDDDIQEVADYYREKFEALGIKPGFVNESDDEDVVFIAEGLVIAISPPDADDVDGNGGGGKTEVVVSSGGMPLGIPGVPQIPGVPGVPAPPAPPAPPTTSPSKTGEAPKSQPAETPKTTKQPK